MLLLDQVFGYAALCYALLFGQEGIFTSNYLILCVTILKSTLSVCMISSLGLDIGPHVIAPFYQHLLNSNLLRKRQTATDTYLS